jgi:hypothetical protein
VTVAVEPALACFCKFALVVILTVSETGTRANRAARLRPSGFARTLEYTAKPIISLEKNRHTGNRSRAVAQALNQALRNLIQDLQKSNQKVK